MKATIEFSLPEETEDFELYSSAPSILLALQDLNEELRKKEKWEEKQDTTWGEVRELFWHFINARNIGGLL